MVRGTADWSRKRPLIRYTTGDDVDELAYRINERIDEIRDHITGTTSDIGAAVTAAASNIQTTIETTSSQLRDAIISTAQETRNGIIDVVSDTINRLAYYNRLIPSGMLVFQATADQIQQMMTYYGVGSGLARYLYFEQYLFGSATLLLLKSISGSSYHYFYRYFAASLQGAISGEVDIVDSGLPLDGGVWVRYTKNGRDRRFHLRYNSSAGTVYIRRYPADWVAIATGVTIRSEPAFLYPLKVVGDPSTNRYVRVYVANEVFDVSSYEAMDDGGTSYNDCGIFFGHGAWSDDTSAMCVNSVSFCHKEE